MNPFQADHLNPSIAQLRALCQGNPEEADLPDEIRYLGVITRNRTSSFQRCLRSYAENCKAFGRDCDFIILDGSEDPTKQAQHQDILKQVKKQFGLRLWYAGYKQKKEFCEMLASRGISEEISKSALLGNEKCSLTTGANRNGFLLQIWGALGISVDDDTVCQVARPFKLGDELAFISKVDPTQIRGYPDTEAAIEAVDFYPQDFIGQHELLLGKRLDACLQACHDIAPPNTHHIDGDFFQRLNAKKGKAVITCNGLVGDSGCGYPGYSLFRSKYGMNCAICSEAEYRCAFSSRDVIRSVSRPIISDESFCMAYCLGIDSRALIPPFISENRAQDVLFGKMVLECCRQDFVGQLPFVVIHTPPNHRDVKPEDFWRSIGRLRINDIIKMVCSATFSETPYEETEKNLNILGTQLKKLGTSAMTEFKLFLQMLIQKYKQQMIGYMMGLLEKFDHRPDYWASDVEKFIQILKNMSFQDFAPSDLMDLGLSASEARELAQKLMFDFSQVCLSWIEITEISQDLKQAGRTLAVDIS